MSQFVKKDTMKHYKTIIPMFAIQLSPFQVSESVIISKIRMRERDPKASLRTKTEKLDRSAVLKH